LGHFGRNSPGYRGRGQPLIEGILAANSPDVPAGGPVGSGLDAKTVGVVRVVNAGTVDPSEVRVLAPPSGVARAGPRRLWVARRDMRMVGDGPVATESVSAGVGAGSGPGVSVLCEVADSIPAARPAKRVLIQRFRGKPCFWRPRP